MIEPLKQYKFVWVGVVVFLAGLLAGFCIAGLKTVPAGVEGYLPDDAYTPRYSVNISQTIEYGLIYTKTDMITGETRMYIIKNGKLRPFLSDNSN